MAWGVRPFVLAAPDFLVSHECAMKEQPPRKSSSFFCQKQGAEDQRAAEERRAADQEQLPEAGFVPRLRATAIRYLSPKIKRMS